mmetsp:Transcript_28887/g.65309  ORF Transcript_28887/g.65309 Transcript_28887/m.65309 type:complete len:238 (+) Transcript_28887:1049-1762(+)
MQARSSTCLLHVPSILLVLQEFNLDRAAALHKLVEVILAVRVVPLPHPLHRPGQDGPLLALERRAKIDHDQELVHHMLEFYRGYVEVVQEGVHLMVGSEDAREYHCLRPEASMKGKEWCPELDGVPDQGHQAVDQNDASEQKLLGFSTRKLIRLVLQVGHEDWVEGLRVCGIAKLFHHLHEWLAVGRILQHRHLLLVNRAVIRRSQYIVGVAPGSSHAAHPWREDYKRREGNFRVGA